MKGRPVNLVQDKNQSPGSPDLATQSFTYKNEVQICFILPQSNQDGGTVVHQKASFSFLVSIAPLSATDQTSSHSFTDPQIMPTASPGEELHNVATDLDAHGLSKDATQRQHLHLKVRGPIAVLLVKSLFDYVDTQSSHTLARDSLPPGSIA